MRIVRGSFVLRGSTVLLALLVLAGCARQLEPYDQDVAWCRRASQSPTTSSGPGSFFLVPGTTHHADHELATGMEERTFRACMRARFQERFPGEPYPLDPPGAPDGSEEQATPERP